MSTVREISRGPLQTSKTSNAQRNSHSPALGPPSIVGTCPPNLLHAAETPGNPSLHIWNSSAKLLFNSLSSFSVRPLRGTQVTLLHQKQALGMASMGPWTGFSSLKPLNFTEIIGPKSAYCKTHKPRYPRDLKRLQQAPKIIKKPMESASPYLALGSITKSSRAPRALFTRGDEQGHCPGHGITTFPAGRPGGGSGRDQPLLSHLLGAALGKDGGHPALRERAGPVLASQGLPEMRSGQGPPWIPDPVSATNSGRAGRPVEGPLSRVTPTKPRLRPELHVGGGTRGRAPGSGTREPQVRARAPGGPLPRTPSRAARACTHGSIAGPQPSAPGGLGAQQPRQPQPEPEPERRRAGSCRLPATRQSPTLGRGHVRGSGSRGGGEGPGEGAPAGLAGPSGASTSPAPRERRGRPGRGGWSD